jgi:DNA replicative helicase MCM subunit Mcm2 (Cdc46/Mcm family)
MPKYYFTCKDCSTEFSSSMSVGEYINSEKKCINCNSSSVLVLLKSSVANFVKRTKVEIIQEAKEEAKVVVDKIKNGDLNTIRDIYGEE